MFVNFDCWFSLILSAWLGAKADPTITNNTVSTLHWFLNNKRINTLFVSCSIVLCMKLPVINWIVLCKYPYVSHDLIPHFNRIRRTSYTDGKLFCNSTPRKVWKHLCAHVICFARFCQPSFIPDHQSISCIWWKS